MVYHAQRCSDQAKHLVGVSHLPIVARHRELTRLRVFGVWASVTLMYLSYQTRRLAYDKL